MTSLNPMGGDPSPEVNKSHASEISNLFSESKALLDHAVEPELSEYDRVAATIDVDTPYAGMGGGSLRPIGDNFTVNPANGTLSLSFPIPTSAGRSGFGPTLSLAYDSGFGNGLFGIGWKLLGVESVSRRTSKAIPKFDDSDLFVMKGTEDIVPSLLEDKVTIEESERNGYIVRQYQPRVVTQVTRIERWTRSNNPNEIHWRTISAANVTTLFGDSDKSRIFETTADGRKRILTWLVSHVYDPFGNAMEYNYKEESNDGIEKQVWERNRDTGVSSRNRYLKSIRYGNRQPHRDPLTWEIRGLAEEPWMFETVLDYGDHDIDYPKVSESNTWALRSDPFSNCRGGFECRTYRLCRRILSFHHIQQGTATRDYPVSSMSFSYRETGMGSFLTSMTFNTYQKSTSAALKVFSLPPHTFKYSEMPSIRSLRLETADTIAIETLADAKAKWLDLDGEGAPGLLTEHRDAAWSYQRNESPLYIESSGPKLGKAQWINSQPGFKVAEKHRFEDLDGNGALDIVYQDQASGYSGFSERLDQSWTNFRPFAANVTAASVHGPAYRIDLTGNGIADIMSINEATNEIFWQESYKKQGFGPAIRVDRQLDGPTFTSSDATGRVYVADMTGDGMADIVHISAGAVLYWPNLGYGRFGSKVVMENAPRFDSHEEFSHLRLRLGDVDGSGTTDLIYLQRNGGLKVFCNLAGNSWSSPQKNPRFPSIDSFSSVFTLDLMGNGTSCLCWTGPSLSPISNSSLHYFDFSAGQKRHLLAEISNGFGSSASFTYRPSTWFYLQDERKGYSWATKLAFPVHCIHKVIKTDHISQTQTQTSFCYHDGYFDGDEREFGGFGMVEIWDSEEFSSKNAKPFRRPQIHTKLWFHTGASNEPSDESISRQSHPPRLASCKLPLMSAITSVERKEACRALRGLEIRKEIYSRDGSASCTDPYLTVDSRYCVELSQSRGRQAYGVFRTIPREVLSTHYERQSGEPRITHEITLEVNTFGDVAKMVSIAYGLPTSGLKELKDKAAQETTVMTYYEREFTNAITKELDNFRKPLLSVARTFRILGFKERPLFDYNELRRDNDSFLKDAKIFGLVESEEAVDVFRKVCIAEKRFYYRSNDLVRRLNHGDIEAFSILDQVYELNFTKDVVDANYRNIESVTGETFEYWMEKGGWVELEKKCHRWWRPSLRYRFSQQAFSDNELQEARNSFYIPTVTLDPFGSQTTVQMDEYHLFPVTITDAVGSTIHAKYDYAHLQPVEVTDANGNRVQMALDSFGRAVGLANMGKPGENIGDNLEEFEVDLDGTTEISCFLESPTPSQALKLLKNASHRKIFDHGRWHQTSTSPNLEVSLTRTTHVTEEASSSPVVSIKIEYLSGSGSVIQTVHLSAVESEDKPIQWHYSEWKDLDNKGNPVRHFRPSFGGTHEFIPQCNGSSPATTLLYDPQDRVVGTLYADHTWKKTRNTAWASVIYSTGNTVLGTDVSTDPDVGGFAKSLDPSTYLPSWVDSRQDAKTCGQWEADAAEKSKQFANKPWTFHLDPLGRAILATTYDGTKELCMRQDFDIEGNLSVNYDKFGRQVDRKSFDLGGSSIYHKNLDAGERWWLSDCMGKNLVSWNSRSICEIRVYDKLRREIQLWVRTQTKKILATQATYGVAKDTQAADNNTIGRITEVKDQSGVLQNTAYDFKGNCIQTKRKITVAYNQDIDWNSDVQLSTVEPYVTSVKFDALNRPTQSTNALGNITFRTYNFMGQLSSCTWQESSTEPEVIMLASRIFDADGQITQSVYGNGTRVDCTYDGKTKRLARKRILQPKSSIRPVFEDRKFTYDCQGRITHIADDAKDVIHFRNTAVDASKDYTYDVQGRLAKAEGREQLDFGSNGGETLLPYDQPDAIGLEKTLTNGTQVCRYAELYTYDDEDNIKSMQHMAVGSSQLGISGWTRNYFYEGDKGNAMPRSNRLVEVEIGKATSSYGYDGPEGLTGCVTVMPGYSHIGWDFRDKMRCSARQKTKTALPDTTWYIYDTNGARIRKVTESSATGQVRKTKETLFIGDAEIYLTYENNGTTIKSTKTIAEVVGDRKIALVESDSVSSGSAHLFRYLVADSVELDDQGNLISYEEYTPFGSTTFIACGQAIKAPSKYRYNSYERDSETGLYFCHARYYLPWLGRWLSPDPAGTIDGHNLYCYVSNDPINYHDPGGTNKDNVNLGSGENQSLPDTQLVESEYSYDESEGGVSEHSSPGSPANSVDLPLPQNLHGNDEDSDLEGSLNPFEEADNDRSDSEDSGIRGHRPRNRFDSASEGSVLNRRIGKMNRASSLASSRSRRSQSSRSNNSDASDGGNSASESENNTISEENESNEGTHRSEDPEERRERFQYMRDNVGSQGEDDPDYKTWFIENGFTAEEEMEMDTKFQEIDDEKSYQGQQEDLLSQTSHLSGGFDVDVGHGFIHTVTAEEEQEFNDMANTKY